MKHFSNKKKMLNRANLNEGVLDTDGGAGGDVVNLSAFSRDGL